MKTSLIQERNIQVQETKSPKQQNPKGFKTRHTIIKMAKVRENLKATKEKQRHTMEPPQGYKLNFQQKQWRPVGSDFIYLKC